MEDKQGKRLYKGGWARAGTLHIGLDEAQAANGVLPTIAEEGSSKT